MSAPTAAHMETIIAATKYDMHNILIYFTDINNSC